MAPVVVTDRFIERHFSSRPKLLFTSQNFHEFFVRPWFSSQERNLLILFCFIWTKPMRCGETYIYECSQESSLVEIKIYQPKISRPSGVKNSSEMLFEFVETRIVTQSCLDWLAQSLCPESRYAILLFHIRTFSLQNSSHTYSIALSSTKHNLILIPFLFLIQHRDPHCIRNIIWRHIACTFLAG